MKLGIMQPYFFPYIGYWQLLNYVDKFVVFDDVNFKKRSWMTRNRIILDGNEKYINLQIQNASQNKLICETAVLFELKERKKLLNTLNLAYRESPYRAEVMEILTPLILNDEENLADFLYLLIDGVKNYLGIKTELCRSSEIRGKEHGASEQGIIELCEQLGATEYINPIGGTELYCKDNFDGKGIALSFLRTNFDKMRQDGLPYVSDYSIIDLMMNLSKEQLADQLAYFDLL